ncbi:MAG TPA: PepSY domain-containing protein, partial [Pyrinomonadaceae bacterium]|nr:PepSY domain-containing protein [Pyrinomonadaceae bacterium]
AKLARQAKITLEQARHTALDTAAGTVEEEELEKEHGRLVYSFDIRNAKGTISEVQVDAKTGAMVSNAEESKADEAKEKSEDAKKERKSRGKH